MSAPTEQPNQPATTVPSKSRSSLVIPVIAMIVSLLAAAISIGSVVIWLEYQPTTYTTSSEPTYEPSGDSPSRPDEADEATVKKNRGEYDKLMTKGRADVRKWAKQRQLGKAKSKNVALAYLCLTSKSTKAGRYYAASQVDEEYYFGIGPYGTLQGNAARTARNLCPSAPKWARN